MHLVVIQTLHRFHTVISLDHIITVILQKDRNRIDDFLIIVYNQNMILCHQNPHLPILRAAILFSVMINYNKQNLQNNHYISYIFLTTLTCPDRSMSADEYLRQRPNISMGYHIHYTKQIPEKQLFGDLQKHNIKNGIYCITATCCAASSRQTDSFSEATFTGSSRSRFICSLALESISRIRFS